MTVMKVDAFESCKERAKELGQQHGKAQATWLVDMNASAESARRALRMYEDDDPGFFDVFDPHVPLSGEYADDYSTAELFEECGYYRSGLHQSDVVAAVEAEAELADAYEFEYFVACADEVVRLLGILAET
ncbi:hypothetical protein E1288_32955 [Saccharopolyspora elongata]|uniref:Uncharacterized protein n=1 Tax=Saccharopolyspora elongata TaxID=2530387 RepID=A0A4V2YK50_9PSEU|nr:hypothetical protein E1288_32955 [Saccharopolyspora elongata]